MYVYPRRRYEQTVLGVVLFMCRDRGVSRHAPFETLRVLVQKTSENGHARTHTNTHVQRHHHTRRA